MSVTLSEGASETPRTHPAVTKMADLTHADSDWAVLGAALYDRNPKPFSRLDRPTPEQVAAAKQILGIHRAPTKRVRGPKGRPKKRPDLAKAAALRRRGLTWTKVSSILGVHRNTLLARRQELEATAVTTE